MSQTMSTNGGMTTTTTTTFMSGSNTGNNEERVESVGSTMYGGLGSDRKLINSVTNTPHGTAADGKTNNPNNNNQKGRGGVAESTYPNFGGHTLVKSTGGFPAFGSTLGPYFCLGRLGKGTFCSIHKCINLDYYSSEKRPRLAAAKVEIGEFKNSGVLGGEATMLQFLDSSLPKDTVPVYMGHLRGGEQISAIVMEYLPGQDMHLIRDWATKYKSRRLAVKDAVYLTADIMLPLLRRMHEVGIVHRDVKPSNCVKRGLKDFAMVDFGLSKSIVVPKDSSLADPEHAFKGKDWIRPPNYTGDGHYRKERSKADFRGTSMYASVRVHQLKDYCPRDDIWGLMYVFCDLVSGGLPWMSHAANRERDACQRLKERIHGEEEGVEEQTERLLMGNEYHVALFNKYKGRIDPPEDMKDDDNKDLPPPLAMSKDAKKVDLLRKAFKHLGTLSFWDIPDYDLIKSCIEGFLDGHQNEDDSITPIDWQLLLDAEQSNKRKEASGFILGENTPTWELDEVDPDPVDSQLFKEAEASAEASEYQLDGEEADMARLPIELRFRISQMEYNSLHHGEVPLHLALRDWLRVALPIAYGDWDTKQFERGGHRSNDDGYRREFLVSLIDKCLKCASKFSHFQSSACVYGTETNGAARKKRKISSSISAPGTGDVGSELLSISQAFFRLRMTKRIEMKKSRAPPPLLSFG